MHDYTHYICPSRVQCSSCFSANNSSSISLCAAPSDWLVGIYGWCWWWWRRENQLSARNLGGVYEKSLSVEWWMWLMRWYTQVLRDTWQTSCIVAITTCVEPIRRLFLYLHCSFAVIFVCTHFCVAYEMAFDVGKLWWDEDKQKQ